LSLIGVTVLYFLYSIEFQNDDTSYVAIRFEVMKFRVCCQSFLLGAL